jgi:hypothetical protein
MAIEVPSHGIHGLKIQLRALGIGFLDSQFEITQVDRPLMGKGSHND